MKVLIVFLLWSFLEKNCYAQQTVYDAGHLRAVNENGAARIVSENTYQSSLEQIKKNTNDIGLNLSSVVLVQNMIHKSLTGVNEALKDGIQIKQMGYLINDLFKNSKEAIEIARNNPLLVLFAEDAARQLKERGVALVGDVSGFVLANKENVLMNYNVRDELIRKVINELMIMNALIYGINQNMYYAKMNGVFRTANPYQQYMQKDFQLVDDIIRKRQMLK